MVATLVLETSVFDVWVRLPPFPPSNKTMNTKSTVKSCSCHHCMRAKGTKRGKILMRLEERAARRDANIRTRMYDYLRDRMINVYKRARQG